MTEEETTTTAGQPVPPTLEYMMNNLRRGVRGQSGIGAQVRSLVPGVVVMMRLTNPENPEASRTAAHGIARRNGFRVRTHKDAADIYWIVRTADDSTNG